MTFLPPKHVFQNDRALNSDENIFRQTFGTIFSWAVKKKQPGNWFSAKGAAYKSDWAGKTTQITFSISLGFPFVAEVDVVAGATAVVGAAAGADFFDYLLIF